MLLNCLSGYRKRRIIRNKEEDEKIKLKMMFKPWGIKFPHSSLLGI